MDIKEQQQKRIQHKLKSKSLHEIGRNNLYIITAQDNEACKDIVNIMNKNVVNGYAINMPAPIERAMNTIMDIHI